MLSPRERTVRDSRGAFPISSILRRFWKMFEIRKPRLRMAAKRWCGPLLDYLHSIAVSSLSRLDDHGASECAGSAQPRVKRHDDKIARSTPPSRVRGGIDVRARCAGYLASSPPKRRVDEVGRIVRPSDRREGPRSIDEKSSSNSDARRRGAPPAVFRRQVPTFTKSALHTSHSLSAVPAIQSVRPARDLQSHKTPALPPGEARTHIVGGESRAGRPRARVPIPVHIIRGREVIYEHFREYWRKRMSYERIFDRMEQLQHENTAQENELPGREQELRDLQQQEDEALEQTNRLPDGLANAQARQRSRERTFEAVTGIVLPHMGIDEPEGIDEFTEELFAEIEDDSVTSATPAAPLSPRAASNVRFDAEMRDAIPPLQDALAALWNHRETYLDQRLAHEAGNYPGLPNWDRNWPRAIIDREHLREGMRLTRVAKHLHDSWRARLKEAVERGLGPFADHQGEVFPHMAEGYAISEENGMIEAAPRNGILAWMQNTPPENR
ncbi:hypothetical protein LTR95_017708 [Oleoguttula sp. CCFEE 5521]